MREPKFRVWDKTDKVMRYYSGIFNNRPGTEKSTFPQYESCIQFHEVEIMEYLGIPDKAGKEVCEGDYMESDSGVIREVIRDKDTGGYKFHSGANIIHSCRMEIVGNRFESPELTPVEA